MQTSEVVIHSLKVGNTRKKHIVGLFGLIVGLAAAASVDQWPRYAAPIQMALYTAMVLVPLLLGLWRDRGRRGFLAGISLVLVLHVFLLYLLRSAFPFRTILVIIPMVLIEGVVMFILMLKILRNG